MVTNDVARSTDKPGTAGCAGEIRAGSKARSEFVISLDFELIWGVRDHLSREAYGQNILGARRAIPAMLDLFARHDIACTWATVGMLFARNRSELLDMLPPPELRPGYTDPRLSNYAYLDEVGENEKDDPFAFGADLIARIADTPRQEIASHTFGHVYALEPGMTVDAYRADLVAAVEAADARGYTVRSIVFPRNQYDAATIEAARSCGIAFWRGNRGGSLYAPRPGRDETRTFRAMRLADSVLSVTQGDSYQISQAEPGNRPASAFLRPPGGRLGPAHRLHVARLMQRMTDAARDGRGFHLWWHPHNFGADVETSMALLEQLIEHFRHLSDRYGMVSQGMAA